jgi:hypothetical protein
MKTAREIADGMAKVRDEDAVMTTLKGEFGDVVGPLSNDDSSLSGAGSKSRQLSFKGMGAKVATHMLGVGGTKALAPSGATIVGQEFVRDPVALGQVAQSLLDVLPVRCTRATGADGGSANRARCCARKSWCAGQVGVALRSVRRSACTGCRSG